MSFKGTVKNGVVVLPPDAKLPEGAAVEVIPEELQAENDPFPAAVLEATKSRPHWPKDYARNVDHYLYGVTKQS